MTKGTETQEEQTEETTETVKTPAEIAADKRAEEAERRAAEKEQEAERAKAEVSRLSQPKTTATQASGYSLSSFSDQEWTEEESRSGLTRQQILANLNLHVQTKGEISRATSRFEAKLAVQQEKESLASEDPLYPKYRKEVDKFLSDIPEEFMSTPESRKKWLAKAFDYGKKSVKLPPPRKADDMSTRETGVIKEKGGGADEFSDSEKAAIESTGKTVDDYKKIKHPYLPDAIRITDKPEEPKFGAR